MEVSLNPDLFKGHSLDSDLLDHASALATAVCFEYILVNLHLSTTTVICQGSSICRMPSFLLALSCHSKIRDPKCFRKFIRVRWNVIRQITHEVLNL